MSYQRFSLGLGLSTALHCLSATARISVCLSGFCLLKDSRMFIPLVALEGDRGLRTVCNKVIQHE